MSNIAQLMGILNEMNIDYIYFRPVEEAPEILPTIDQLLSLKRQLHKKVNNMRLRYILRIHDRLVSQNNQLPCVSHLLSCIIHADGDVVLCEKRQGHPIILGNITKEPFELIWNSIKHKHVSKRLCDPSEQKECSVCRMTYLNRVFTQLINLNPHFV